MKRFIYLLMVLLPAAAFNGCISVRRDVPATTVTTTTQSSVPAPRSTTVERTTTY